LHPRLPRHARRIAPGQQPANHKNPFPVGFVCPSFVCHSGGPVKAGVPWGIRVWICRTTGGDVPPTRAPVSDGP
jgi:hypothetical protein